MVYLEFKIRGTALADLSIIEETAYTIGLLAVLASYFSIFLKIA